MFDCAFYIVAEAEACAAAAQMAHPEDALEISGLTDTDVAIVFAIAAGEPFDFDRHAFEPLAEEQDYSLFQLPPDFVRLLADADEGALRQWAHEWRQTEEMQIAFGSDANDESSDEENGHPLLSVLTDWAALARRACGRSVFMMMYTDSLPDEAETNEYARSLN